MNDNLIRTEFSFPLSIINPLAEVCFGEEIDNYRCKKLVGDSMSIHYTFFKLIRDKGKVIASIDMFRDENTQMIDSLDSLQPFKSDFECSKNNMLLSYTASRRLFDSLKDVSYSRQELEDLTRAGMPESGLLKDMIENSLASLYWSLLNVSNGRRIGAVDYKGNIPDVKGNFYEIDLQQFLPLYDELKAFSLDEKDFSLNASIEEIADRLLDTRDDLMKAVKTGESGSVIDKLSDYVKNYTDRLDQDPKIIFREAGLVD